MRTWALFLLLAGAAAPALAAPDENRSRHRERVDGPEMSAGRPQRASADEQGQSRQRQFSSERRDRAQASEQRSFPGNPGGHRRQVEASVSGAGADAAADGSARSWRRAQGNGASGRVQSGWQPRERRIRTLPETSPVASHSTSGPHDNWRSTHRRRDYRDGIYARWSTSHWRGDHRYDWRRYRDRHRSLFRPGYYYDPFGWSYRRWHTGSYLYPSYYGSRYWLNDPWYYRLPSAYGPYQWVRYWNDALLVNTYTGEVVDVIRAFFW